MDKRHIDRSFSLASSIYDDHAGIQRRIGGALLAGLSKRLVTLSSEPHEYRIIDAGCGTGYFIQPLIQMASAGPCASAARHDDKPNRQTIRLVALDRSAGMLEVLGRRPSRAPKDGDNLSLLQADLESLPLRTSSCDVIFSNLAMQWLDRPSLWLNEAMRALRPGGWLACSTLLAGSLAEIQAAWSGLDNARHVNSFETLNSLKCAAPEHACVIQQRFTEYFPSALDAMRSVKGVGAHTVLHGARQQLTSPARMRAVLSTFEQERLPEGVPLSYEAGFIFCQKAKQFSVV